MPEKREHSQEILTAFDELCDDLSALPEFKRETWFGTPAARVWGEMCLALWGDALVAKLGAAEVERRSAAGEGERFDPSGRGKSMKDWLESTAPTAEWSALAEAAVAFVAPDA